MSRFLDAEKEVEQARAPQATYPTGVEPGVTWDGDKGTIGAVTSKAPDWRALLSDWDLDPEIVEVVDGTVQYRSWDAAIGNGEVRRMHYHRATLRRKRTGGPDIDELMKLVRKRPPKTSANEPLKTLGGSAFVVAISDPQIGKEGTAATVDRFVAGVDDQVRRLKELRRVGRKLDDVYLPHLGDLIEGCDGHYAMQTFGVELDAREQRRLARRLSLYLIDAFRPLAGRIVVPAVAGNHGENRRDGKAFTTFGDNSDLEIPEGVAEACATNPDAYGHVAFVIPKSTLTLTLDIGGVIVGMAHGHQAKRGGTTPQQKIANWWSGQAFGQRPVGDARILLTGHSHHLSVIDHGPRTHIQAPTMDSGSQWFEEATGANSHSGMMSVVIGAEYPMGWTDLHVA